MRRQVGEAVGLPVGVARVLDRPAEAEQLGEPLAVEGEARAVHPAGAGGTAVDPFEVAAQALEVAQRGMGERQQPVAGRGRLRRLQVGVVGQERVALTRRDLGERGPEARDRGGEVEHAGAQGDPERDPPRLAARAAGVEPARRAPDPLLELALAHVREIAVARVDLDLLVQQPDQRADQRAAVAGRDGVQRDRMREVGEPEPARQQRRIGELELVTGLDQLRRRTTADRATGPQVSLGRLSHRRAPAARARRPSPGRAPAAEAPPAARATAAPRSRDRLPGLRADSAPHHPC